MKRILFAILIAVALTTAMFAQRGRPGGMPPAGEPPAGSMDHAQRPDPLTGLKTALDLTDGQVEAIKALLQTRATRREAIMTEIQAKRQALEAALNAASPNPTDVGNAAIALRATEKKLAAEQDWFIAELKKLLTGDQQQKLDTLIAANPRGLPFLGGPGFGPGPGRGRGR